MIITNCKNCGEEITNKYASRIKMFCNHNCANTFNNAKRKGKYTVERIILVCEYCNEEFTTTSALIEKRMNEGGHKIRYCSQKCMGLSNKTAIIKSCPNCGKEFETTRAECCSNKCAYEYKIKTGSTKRSGFWYENGYKVLYVEGDNHIMEHINNMEIHIGRKLEKNEVVHHINLDRLDNRIENLKLMARGEHASYHRKLEIKSGKQIFGRVAK